MRPQGRSNALGRGHGPSGRSGKHSPHGQSRRYHRIRAGEQVTDPDRELLEDYDALRHGVGG